jgi:hypothetical protein
VVVVDELAAGQGGAHVGVVEVLPLGVMHGEGGHVGAVVVWPPELTITHGGGWQIGWIDVPVACACIGITHGGRQVLVGPDAVTHGGGTHVGVVTVEEEPPEFDSTQVTGTQAGPSVIGQAVPTAHGGGGQAMQMTPRGGAGRPLELAPPRARCVKCRWCLRRLRSFALPIRRCLVLDT